MRPKPRARVSAVAVLWTPGAPTKAWSRRPGMPGVTGMLSLKAQERFPQVAGVGVGVGVGILEDRVDIGAGVCTGG